MGLVYNLLFLARSGVSLQSLYALYSNYIATRLKKALHRPEGCERLSTSSSCITGRYQAPSFLS
jgi:hypothetical protein